MSAPTNFGMVNFNYSPIQSIRLGLGYTVSSINGSRFFNDARDVNGSMVSTYQSPQASVAWTARKGWIWKGSYNFYGYGEGGPSGAPYCSTSNPTPVTVLPCNSPLLGGAQTGLTNRPPVKLRRGTFTGTS